MKLYYRGVSYEYDEKQIANRKTAQPFQPVRRCSGDGYNLKYRGLNYHVEPNRKQASIPVIAATYQLIYRGTSYTVNRTAQGEISVVSQPASATKLNRMSVAGDLKLQQ